MRKHVLLLAMMTWLSWLPAGDAQTSAAPAGVTQFDGTYALVRRTKLAETYVNRGGHLERCPDPSPRWYTHMLTVANGQARLKGVGEQSFTGTVGPNGELDLRYFPVAIAQASWVHEVMIEGKIDTTGTIRARQIGYGCNYDAVWQRVPR